MEQLNKVNTSSLFNILKEHLLLQQQKISFESLEPQFLGTGRTVVNTDKHHVVTPRLYDLGAITTQPDMYDLEATKSSVEATPHKRKLPL